MVFNARSLRNKTFGVCEFLKESNCDVCFITEAWIKVKDEAIIAEIIDMGFELKFQPRKGSKKGGGVCVIYRPELSIEKCNLKLRFKTFEILQTTIKSNSSLYRVSTFYRTGHLSLTERSVFINELDSYLESLTPLKGIIILCGDFNIHVENPLGQFVSSLYSTTETYGFTQIEHDSTYCARGTLDLIFIQDEGVLNLSQ